MKQPSETLPHDAVRRIESRKGAVRCTELLEMFPTDSTTTTTPAISACTRNVRKWLVKGFSINLEGKL